MPWRDDSIVDIVSKAYALIEKEFSITPQVDVYLCSRDELILAVLEELQLSLKSSESIQYAKEYLLPSIIGKFFKLNQQIWLVDGYGNNIDTLLHEILHSIQECSGSREPITDFITFRLTGNRNYISDYDLENWLEIEHKNGWNQIKRSFRTPGDCEDF